MVHWLAEGLAARGHRVTLIGAGLDWLPAGGYFVADTEVSGERLDPSDADNEHAVRAGKILEQVAVDLVADHSRAGYLPDAGRRVLFGACGPSTRTGACCRAGGRSAATAAIRRTRSGRSRRPWSTRFGRPGADERPGDAAPAPGDRG
jgi:hypothetical protein